MLELNVSAKEAREKALKFYFEAEGTDRGINGRRQLKLFEDKLQIAIEHYKESMADRKSEYDKIKFSFSIDIDHPFYPEVIEEIQSKGFSVYQRTCPHKIDGTPGSDEKLCALTDSGTSLTWAIFLGYKFYF